jgi:cytochrome c oxidase assembly protein subunit 15
MMSNIDLPSMTSPALHRYAMVCVGATLCLIFIGGLVTSTRSALAVPDWPLAFGHLIPKLEGGVRFEYGHRVAAAIVSMLTLGLAVWTGRAEPQAPVRRMALAAFALVIFQAVLGGVTVLLELPLAIAVAHAAAAQAFLCLLVAISVAMNPQFAISSSSFGRRRLSASLPTQTAVTTAAIYMQILIGAVMRHLGAGLVIPDFPLSYGHLIPPLNSGFVMINFAHRCGALIVALLVVRTVGRVLRNAADEPRLRRPAIALLGLLVLQITLGALTVWSSRAVLPTTAHVAIGAAVLAMSLVLTIRIYALDASHAHTEPARLHGAQAVISRSRAGA